MDTPSLKDVFKSERHEEYVEYLVFPSLPSTASDEEMEEVLFKLNAACQNIMGEYIWHNEPFGLRKCSLPLSHFEEEDDENDVDKESRPTHETDDDDVKDKSNFLYFHGITHFGDNLEDEWFIVHILKELSRQSPDVVVRVVDNDGEFLLIEAADYLPNWAESDAFCRQRVFIQKGKVHLIPKELSKTTPCLGSGVKLIKSHSEDTLASEAVQKSIEDRIGIYPKKMEESFHEVNIMLPPLLAGILKEKPSLVAAGVNAFYNRDPISLKATRLMKTFKPGDCLVKTRVRFTRCLYAMLAKQDFRPDTKSGWSLPRPTASDYKAHSLGAKLTTGFEILMSRVATMSPSTADGSFNDCNPGWLRYVETLKKTGYFRGYLEGSKPYEQLLSGSKDFFRANLSTPEDRKKEASSEDILIKDLKTIAETIQIDIEKLKEDGETLPEDDNDSWLDIKPEDLESMLEAKFQSGGLNPGDIPSKLKEFMKQISDFSGVEPSDNSTNNSNSNSTTGSARGNGGSGDAQIDDFGDAFDFRADDFVSALDKLLNDLGGPDKDWEASDDSYGSEEDDFDVNLEDIKKKHQFSKESAEFFGIMNSMDKELASTNVGKTFKQSSSSSGGGNVAENGAGSSSSSTKYSSSTRTSKVATASVEELDEFDEEEGLQPVNIDMNALANILESFQSQDGPSGPSANLLRSVGFDIKKVGGKKK